MNAILPGLVAGDRQRNVLSAKAQRLGKSFDEVEQDAFSYTSIKDYVTSQDIADQIMYLASPWAAHLLAGGDCGGWGHENVQIPALFCQRQTLGVIDKGLSNLTIRTELDQNPVAMIALAERA